MDRAVIATASELFEARHYPSVVAVCSDALDGEPECLPLILIRARAHIALRRDLEAQADLRDLIRLAPACGIAYRLLGELAARRDENEPAALFFREALRLDPTDREAADWLAIVEVTLRPAAGVQLPAIAPAAGRVSPSPEPAPPGPPGPNARLAHGTQPPVRDRVVHQERPTAPMVAGGDHRDELRRVARGSRMPAATPTPTPAPLPPPPEVSTLTGRPPPQRPAKDAPRRIPRPRTVEPDAPGFDEYLLANGILTRERLRAAQAYQRSMNVQLSTAIVTLGLASPQRIEWAVVAHRSQLRDPIA